MHIQDFVNELIQDTLRRNDSAFQKGNKLNRVYYDEILAKVRKKFPVAKTSLSSIRWYVNNYKKNIDTKESIVLSVPKEESNHNEAINFFKGKGNANLNYS